MKVGIFVTNESEPARHRHGLRRVAANSDTAVRRAASALIDDLGHRALMSCQHANRLGAAAGHNAAADLLGVPLEPYR